MDQSKKTTMEHSDLPQGLSLSAVAFYTFLPLSNPMEAFITNHGESSLSTTMILSEIHATVLQQRIAGMSFIPFILNQRQRQLPTVR